MKNKILFLPVFLILIFVLASCSLTDDKDKTGQLSNQEISDDNYEDEPELDIMPFRERKFIYKNGLEIEHISIDSDEDDKSVWKHYPRLSGLIDKEAEKKINDKIENQIDKKISEAESYVAPKLTDNKIQSVSSWAHIEYNCNNVIFINYNSDITYGTDTFSESKYFSECIGYDLNTGNTIGLKDLFKSGLDYSRILNDLIYMEIIKLNYDDPDSFYMYRPFQGIRENQSFSFSEYYLKIIIDEKNDEFNTSYDKLYIYITMKDIGDYLAIFDRYFDEGKNIYENDRIKLFMPNFAGYSAYDIVREHEEKYYIDIEIGEFYGIEDIETKKLLNEAVSPHFDADGFRERAKAYSGTYYGGLYHYIKIHMDNGGYISLNTFSDKNELDAAESHIEYVNFDLNNNKFMTLKDLFVDGFDYKTAIWEILKNNPDYRIPETIFLKGKEILMSENEFNFSQNSLLIYLYQDDMHTYNSWIEYKDIGYENISIFQ
ncbi:hypothetical protein [Sedimentibacter sp.]|uniref:hypothetical protein n=1 Tax=Sedimentibacter sp. TaxID=1960295 RepID=UPI00289E3FA6|nr:hypothetical protein [Sedimentibacter sp.]